MRHNPTATPRPRVPLALVVAGVVVVLIPIVVVLAWLGWQWHTLEIEAPSVAQRLRYVLFIAPVVVGLWAVVIALYGLYNRWAGRAAAFADKTVALTLAQRSQGLPAHIQSLSYTDSHKALPLPAPDLEIAAQIAPPSVPPFSELLDQGRIGSGKPLILAYNAMTSMPITGDWKDLYSCGVGAQMGAGKSWLMAFLLAQSVAAGGRLIVCDLHAGDPESLTNRIAGLGSAFMCDPATTPAEIEAALKLANDKLIARKGNTARWPIVIACDEWTSLLRTSAGSALPKYLQDIAEQGRKYNVNAILAAQAWTKDASSAVRNQLTSHYVLRQRPEEARYQLGLRADQMPDDIRSLPDASGYFLNVRGELVKIVIPLMTSADIARCGELIARPANAIGQPFGFQKQTLPLTPSAQVWDANGTQMGRKPNDASTPTQRVQTASPEAVLAAGLFLSGKSAAEIAQELRGVDITKGGRNAKAVREEIERLIREGI